MCGCEPGFTCSMCRGTSLDHLYPHLPEPREEQEERDKQGPVEEERLL